MIRRRFAFSLAVAASIAAAAPAAAAADDIAAQQLIDQLPACTYYAAPGGSDYASGTEAAPLRTANKLVSKLKAGQAGCLKSGTYTGNVAFRRGGSYGKRIALRAAPGADAVVRGQIYVPNGSSHIAVADLELDGTSSTKKPSPMVNGDAALFVGNDIHSDTETCFVLGDPVWGVPEGTLIIGNHIHDCGVDGTNKDHGVYIRYAIGTLIEGNLIRSNPDRGVQLYPNADDSIIRGNVIDANGQGVQFSGSGTQTSDRNLVEANLITGSRLRYDIDYWWSDSGFVGADNAVRANCIWGGTDGEIRQPVIGFALGRNTIADPLYLLTGLRYELAPETPCPVAPPVLP